VTLTSVDPLVVIVQMSPARSKAISVPSGAYAGSAAPSPLVSARRSVPSDAIVSIVPPIANAIRVPSGDQSGAEIEGVDTSIRSLPVRTSRSTSSSPDGARPGPRTKATVLPSGETAGIWS
jgi:hypothetical protein